MLKLAKSILKKKRGEVAVEWIILFPLMFMIVMFSIMYLIFTMDFLMLSNSCTDLAQMMNMGDTAYKSYSSSPVTNYYTKAYSVVGVPGEATKQLTVAMANKEADKTINVNVTSSADNVFANAFYEKFARMIDDGRFKAPFCTIEEINCRVYTGESGGGTVEDTSFNTNERETESGNMVDVEVKYKFLFLNISQHGYGFII